MHLPSFCVQGKKFYQMFLSYFLHLRKLPFHWIGFVLCYLLIVLIILILFLLLLLSDFSFKPVFSFPSWLDFLISLFISLIHFGDHFFELLL